MSPDKVIARRVAREVRPRELAIYGFGAATDVPLIMAEQGLFEGDGLLDYPATTEHGAYGGIVMPGWQFSANLNPDAIVDGLSQFDVIDGGLCKFAALSFAQYDARGVVNVSRFGAANPGAGGFIDIAENAERLVFAGTFTTGGLVADVRREGLRVVKEGPVRKFVQAVESITYRAGEAVADGRQDAMIVTERAVFRIKPDGLVLTEIAPGVDVRRDVLGQMDFPPARIAEPLAQMPADCFATDASQLAQAG
jgi:propionate CoA-transferase